MTVFTTHTPVAAGHDRFPAAAGRGAPGQDPRGAAPLLRRLHGPGPGLPGRPQRAVLHDRAGPEALAARQRRQRPARRRSRGGCGSRSIPNRPEEEVPIGHITNGVHVQSWVAPQMHQLFDRHLGPDWPTRQRDPETWEGIDDGRGRRALGDAAGPQGPADRLRPPPAGRPGRAPGRGRRGRPERAATALDLNALTIGFARRFATYKRAGPGPPATSSGWPSMINAADRPIQFIFAGKAHPEDHFGKELIQNIVQLTRRTPVRAPDRLRRGLRHERRPPARPGGRRLAEQPAAAAGGQRHLGREGRCSTAA